MAGRIEVIVRNYTLEYTSNGVPEVSMDIAQYGDVAWVMNVMEVKKGAYRAHFKEAAEELAERGVILVSGYTSGIFARSAIRLAQSLGYRAEIVRRSYIPHDGRNVVWMDIWIREPDKIWKYVNISQLAGEEG